MIKILMMSTLATICIAVAQAQPISNSTGADLIVFNANVHIGNPA